VGVPVSGDWQLAVTVRTSAIDEATGYVEVPIGEDLAGAAAPELDRS
jgi:hypothetical protein